MGGPVLLVLPVEGRGLFRGDRLWAKVSEMEVEPWVNHRWALPAPEVVRQALAAWARGTGLFSRVTTAAAFLPGREGLTLSAVLLALEEEDTPKGIWGRVRMELELSGRAAGGRVHSWRGIVEEREPVEEKSAAGVVRALGRALARGMDKALQAWKKAGILGGN